MFVQFVLSDTAEVFWDADLSVVPQVDDTVVIDGQPYKVMDRRFDVSHPPTIDLTVQKES